MYVFPVPCNFGVQYLLCRPSEHNQQACVLTITHTCSQLIQWAAGGKQSDSPSCCFDKMFSTRDLRSTRLSGMFTPSQCSLFALHVSCAHE
jgi:hypothetical protein